MKINLKTTILEIDISIFSWVFNINKTNTLPIIRNIYYIKLGDNKIQVITYYNITPTGINKVFNLFIFI